MRLIIVQVILVGLININCRSLPAKPENIPINDFSYLTEYLNSYIPLKMNDASIVGLSINVMSDKKVLFSKGFGYADKEKGITVTPDTIFRVGSVSKIVNLVMTMKLVEEGKLNLDVDISKYLPELKLKTRFPKSKPITIRSILTHHSGIPSDRMKGFFSKGKANSLAELVSQLNEEYVSYPPDMIYSYSNLAHSILGRIIEKVSGDTYEDAVSKKIFKPLQMEHSFYSLDKKQNINFSKGYGGKVFRAEVEEPNLRDLPAGFLHSSVNDLSKFIQMFLNNGKIGNTNFLKESTLEEMYRTQNGGNPYDDEFRTGLGFFINTLNLGNNVFSVEHAGDTFLFHAMLGILPREKLGVIVMSNSNSSASLVHQVAKKSLEISLETKTGSKRSTLRNRTGNTADLSEYAGVYQNGALLDVQVENGKAFAKVAAGVNFILPEKENEWQWIKMKLFGIFNLTPPSLLLKFKKVGEDRIIYVKAGETVMIWGSKISPQKNMNSKLWEKRIGKYKILNPDLENSNMLKDPELKMENGFLVLENNGIPAASLDFKQKFALKILNDSEAIIDGLGRARGDSVIVKNINNKEILFYSGYELEKIN